MRMQPSAAKARRLRNDTVPARRRRKGSARIRQILDSARAVLAQGGYSQFTMRKIAHHAGLNLGLVHYYFPNRTSLIKALTADIAEGYAQRQARIFTKLSEPMERFLAVVDFSVDDAFAQDIRRLFINLWALLESERSTDDNLLSETYAMERRQFQKLLAPMALPVNKRNLTHRIVILTAMIEGLMLMISTKNESNVELNGIKKSVRALARRLAMDPTLLDDSSI